MIEVLRHVLRRLAPELGGGVPTRWDEPIAEYVVDEAETPEHWAFDAANTTHGNIYRVYSDGSIEEFDNAPLTLDELEQNVLNAISALACAYRVQAKRAN